MLEADPDTGLRFAISLRDIPTRGRAAPGSNLISRDTNFNLSSLGSNWQLTLKGWNEEIRAEFVGNLLHFGKAVRELAPFALADSSMK